MKFSFSFAPESARAARKRASKVQVAPKPGWQRHFDHFGHSFENQKQYNQAADDASGP